MNDLAEFKTDHLFLLVGSNPLPNYVATRLLAHQQTQLYFVYSKETGNIARNLARCLNFSNERAVYIEVNDADAHDIFEKVQKCTTGKTGSVGLHYTGGTKAMAVHAYRAVYAVNPEAVFSYLNARNLKMLIDQAENNSVSVSVGLSVPLRFEELLELHNKYRPNPKKLPNFEPFQPDFGRAMLQVPHKDLRTWCDKNLKSEKRGGVKEEKELTTVDLPLNDPAFASVHSFWANCLTLNDLASKWGKGVRFVAKFLDGDWLEHYTLWSIQQVQTVSQIGDYRQDVNLQNIKYPAIEVQFDVAAMRGYQLFGLSCTTDATKSLIKSKLFEVYERVRQMGGEEARVGIVCYDNDPALTQKELEDEWEEAKAKVRVFGQQHLARLPEYLRDWFNHSSQ